jgi:dihydrofolate reductase
VAAAITRAQGLVGDRGVAVAGGTTARQCLDLGLLDEVAVDLVPVVMGEGNRPFFGELCGACGPGGTASSTRSTKNGG